MTNDPKKQKGLTLIELMVTIAVVAILTSVAVPMYSSYTLKSSRTAAKTILQKISAKQENFYINNKQYTGDLTDLGYGSASVYVNKQSEETTSAAAVYQINVSGSATAFSISAVPQNHQADDTDCGTLTLNNLGVKGATGSKGVNCW
jgi:type IV pilus assembly protein PilE